MGGMVPAEGMRLLELACLQEALGPLLGCPCCCSGQLQLHEDVRHSSGLYSALCFACQACHHRLPIHSSCRSESQGWQVNVCTQQVKTQLGIGEDLLRNLFRIYRIPYREVEECSSDDVLLDCFLDRGDSLRNFVCSLCDQTFECVKILKQHMSLHTVDSIECLDNVNMIGSLERSSNQQHDALHMPIESIVTEAGLDFPSPDVEKGLQLSPKGQVYTSTCNQRFEELDLLDQNINGDSLHSTFEYADSFDETTRNFSHSLSQPTKDLQRNASTSSISSDKYISCSSSPNEHSAASANQKLSCSVLEHAVSHLEHNDVNDLHMPKSEHDSDESDKTSMENNIDAIVINTALQFQTSPIESKHPQSDSIPMCSDIPLNTPVNTIKSSECNGNSNNSAFSELKHGHCLSETANMSAPTAVLAGLNNEHCSKNELSKTANISAHTSTKAEVQTIEYHPLTDKLNSELPVHKGAQENTSSSKFSCKICSQTFNRMGALKQHMVQHNGEVKCVCNECSAVFDDDSQLEKHMSDAHNKRKYSCSFCGKAFKKAFNLAQHARTHTGEKPFLCSTCGKSFSDASTFNKHQKTLHSGERMLKCSTCSKCFYHAGHLRVHMRQHTGEKPYMCQLCGKTYAYPDSVKKHMKIHLDEKNITCNICGRSFRWKESLKQHLKTHQQHQQQQPSSDVWLSKDIQQRSQESSITTSAPVERTVPSQNISPERREMSFLESGRDTFF